ncbi:cytochrome C assembly family protein [Nisaea nitritireducens]|uniref:cytochrome C assembly family protein n=1 Tax=Nisaea nitritireducens TaxID=568392 RepID=UPI0018673DE0|nr:cytochrome c biogenesis protein CcsA [Nisaea nitritireducens]
MSLLLNMSALLALVPVGLFALRSSQRTGGLFWCLLSVAAAGPVLFVVVSVGTAWRSDLAMALWLAVCASLLIYLPLCWFKPEARGLTVLLMPYLFLLTLIATIAGASPHIVLNEGLPGTWFSAHIAVALATYALLTLAAITGLAIFIKERALKLKRSATGIAPALPSVADSEKLQSQLLGAAVIVLLCGLATGVALQNYLTGHVLEFDHKTVLSLVTLAILTVLWLVNSRFGMRGRTVSRLVLVAYLLLTLAYPGVKFVAEILS